MIEVVSLTSCTACGRCIVVCPMNVFDDHDGVAVIARQEDCQTCYMCEAYCPADALFVAPLARPAPAGSPYTNEQHLRDAGLFGSYRRQLGWGPGRLPGSTLDVNHRMTLGLLVPDDETQQGPTSRAEPLR